VAPAPTAAHRHSLRLPTAASPDSRLRVGGPPAGDRQRVARLPFLLSYRVAQGEPSAVFFLPQGQTIDAIGFLFQASVGRFFDLTTVEGLAAATHVFAAFFFTLEGMLIVAAVAMAASVRARLPLAGWGAMAVLAVAFYSSHSGADFVLSADYYAFEASLTVLALAGWRLAAGRQATAGIGRVVVLPDNRYTGGSVEEAFLKGLSDHPSWNLTSGRDTLERLLPHVDFVASLVSLDPRKAVFWIDGPGLPALADVFPVLAERRAKADCREYAVDTWPWRSRSIVVCAAVPLRTDRRR
jgi:hypothetical protein